MFDLDQDRFRKTGRSVGTWWYTMECSEEEMNEIADELYAKNPELMEKLD